MESPKTSTSGHTHHLSTPKHSRKLYWPELNEENSPKFCGIQEMQEEVGWDDSPEPIRLDPKLIANYAKKRADSRSSPVSTHARSKPRTRTFPKQEVHNTQDLELMDDLSRKVFRQNVEENTSELTSMLHDDLAETLIACTQRVENIVTNSESTFDFDSSSSSIENVPLQGGVPKKPTISRQLALGPVIKLPDRTLKNDVAPALNEDSRSLPVNRENIIFKAASLDRSMNINRFKKPDGNNLARTKEPALLSATSSSIDSNRGLREDQSDSVMLSFQDGKDDEWMSQIIIETKKTPGKSKVPFAKSRSDNQLKSPGQTSIFRRSSSFNLDNQCDSSDTQPPKKPRNGPGTQTQCSLEEIEKKRLAAKFRKEFKEIERKKLEALRRLNEKKSKLSNSTVTR